MADTNLNMGDMNPEQVKQRFGWATEATLTKILASSKVSENTLLKIAQHFKIDIDQLRQLNDSINRNASSSESIVSGIDTLNRNSSANHKTMVKATRGLSEGLIKEFMNTKGEQAKGLFDIFSVPLHTFSNRIEFVNGTMFKFSMGMAKFLSTIGVIVGRLQEMNDTMRALYASGARLEIGQVGLLRASTNVGLTLQEFSKILTKYGNVTVGIGTKRLLSLTQKFAEGSNLGSEFLMTQAEVQEAFLDTMNIMQNAGILRSMSDQQITTASKDYLLQINELSAATGKNREEIRKNALAVAQTPSVFTALRTLPKDIRDNFNKILTNVSARFGTQGTRMMDEIAKYMTGGVGMMTREYQLLFSTMGAGMGRELQNLAKASEIGDVDAANRSLERMGILLDELTPAQQKQIQLYSKVYPGLHEVLVGLQKDTLAATARRKLLAGMNEDDRKAYIDQENRQKEEQKAFNETQKALSGLRNTVDGVIARLGPVIIPTLDALARSLSWTLDVFNTYALGIQNMLEPILGKGGSTVAGGVVAGLTTAAILFIVRKVFQVMMGGAAKMLGSVMGPILGTGAAGAAAVGGKAVGSMLGGLGTGLSMLGKPQVLLGIAALAGIGGTFWIAAKALKEFSELNWETIGKGFVTILGMGVLGAVAGAASPLLITGALAIGALGLALIPFAAALRIAGPAMDQFSGIVKASFDGLSGIIDSVGNAISNVINAFTKMRTDMVEKTTDQIERLSKLPSDSLLSTANGINSLKAALEDFQPGILTGFSQFMGSFLSSDPVERLQKLATLGNQLGTAATNIDKFRTSIGPLIGQPVSNNTSTVASQGVSPVITTEQLSRSTLKYYEDSLIKLNTVIEELNKSNELLESIRNNNNSNNQRLVSAVESSGQRIR